MQILLTGASSFTGYWFAKALSEAGHRVICIIRHPLESYAGIRRKRLEQLLEYAAVHFSISYGSEEFLHLISHYSFDLFCHHAADVTNYKSSDFNPIKALENNVGPIQLILNALNKAGCQRIILTGSIFEQNEGAGSDAFKAVSPYGLSKGLTAETFKFYCASSEFRLGKFVIPNPFGPYEEPRFTSFLVQNWFEKKCVNVSMPAYVRDNIHVSLLAKAYVHFAESLPNTAGFMQFNPSGYPESQGAFTQRFATEMRTRLSLPCEFILAHQKEFPEPKVRINTDLLDADTLNWNEKEAWDQLADYYQIQHSPSLVT